jgi:hypothetical protein
VNEINAETTPETDRLSGHRKTITKEEWIKRYGGNPETVIPCDQCSSPTCEGWKVDPQPYKPGGIMHRQPAAAVADAHNAGVILRIGDQTERVTFIADRTRTIWWE